MQCFLFAGYFSPRRAKNNLQRKKRTMLPQAKIVACVNPIVRDNTLLIYGEMEGGEPDGQELEDYSEYRRRSTGGANRSPGRDGWYGRQAIHGGILGACYEPGCYIDFCDYQSAPPALARRHIDVAGGGVLSSGGSQTLTV
jgi:hypothetical protein